MIVVDASQINPEFFLVFPKSGIDFQFIPVYHSYVRPKRLMFLGGNWSRPDAQLWPVPTLETFPPESPHERYHSHRNQLRRAIGKFAVVYCGGVEGGTVKAESDGKMYDWWFTETVLSGNFKLIRIVEAR